MVSIGASAFARCYSLKAVVILPTSIDIGSNALYADSALTRIDATTGICEKVLSSCNGTCSQFRGCPIPSSTPTRLPPPSLLPSSRSPSISINTITCSSCYQCSLASTNYYFTALIPAGDTAITASAFYECNRLTAIVIPT